MVGPISLGSTVNWRPSISSAHCELKFFPLTVILPFLALYVTPFMDGEWAFGGGGVTPKRIVPVNGRAAPSQNCSNCAEKLITVALPPDTSNTALSTVKLPV